MNGPRLYARVHEQTNDNQLIRLTFIAIARLIAGEFMDVGQKRPELGQNA